MIIRKCWLGSLIKKKTIENIQRSEWYQITITKTIRLLFQALFFVGIWVLTFCLLAYVDFDLISPIFLPDDPCYYHFHEIPWWVDKFYMNGASNGHPEFSFLHLYLLLILSLNCSAVIAILVKSLIWAKSP